MTISRLSKPGVQPRVVNQPWAQVTGGTVTTYTKADGSVMEVHTFTADGTLTVAAAGYAECLLVGGGGNCDSNRVSDGGQAMYGMYALPAGSLAVNVGAGGAWGGNGEGEQSSIASVAATAVATGYASNTPVGAAGVIGNLRLGLSSSITGAAVTYGTCGVATPAANKGESPASGNANGSSGVVIVAVQSQAATASGVIASGGTVTNYTGDGSNGVLNQPYTVRTFTSGGTLTVTAPGFVDVLVVGGGGAGGGNLGGGGGGGGHTLLTGLYLPIGSHTVTVGQGGAQGSGVGASGGYSNIAGYAEAPGGGGGGSNGTVGVAGASGGGGGGIATGSNPAGGLTVASYGFAGGAAFGQTGVGPAGGGGGAGAVGGNASSSTAGNGGAGVSNSITGSAVTRAGGGGGGVSGGTAGTAGSGGAGAGSNSAGGAAATANTGSGGGGGVTTGGAGGTGVVIIRYKTV